ncbi:actin-related protein 2/3 complex subunit 1A [Physcomitrium patens]|uniref:Actin-related protein 2/3 complex subunit n=2 Tax=Physcomitrium patens TaxID=3218 RepID=A0A2K1IZY5_PHYPA|nr:actin-related protein 2/3 complex subunit 1A-like isoform X2 [Physcomitrium patens]PNR34836.1 hypothetical protein PHYPA_022734 [Physcomitrium patens]|eukprot:XP_024402979.1 actin-related protein 2/3 complex subunit 1A-like isoform X2 [Physcomitrella patens]
MAAVGVQHLAQCITCHAWNSDMSMVALCPNNNEVHIYKASMDSNSVWERVYVLEKHEQLVSGIDWAPKSNKIVTCSHDRNSYVWSLEGDQWQATLVILRLNRAATSVEWSPQENKFVVGSGAKTVCVCYYEEDNNWWVSKLIRKKHHSTITSVAWHPNNVLLATTSTDSKCRIFSAFIKGVDARKDATTAFGDVKFGEELIQLDLACGWSFGVHWSPSGNSLAYVGHDSTIHFVTDVGPNPRARSISLRHLPLRDVLFLSETRLVAGGFDCNPMLFGSDKSRIWEFISFLDEVKRPAETKTDTVFAAAKGKFKWLGSEPFEENAPTTTHENCITMIRSLAPLSERNPEKSIERFSTSGLDGRVVIWDLTNVDDVLARLRI